MPCILYKPDPPAVASLHLSFRVRIDARLRLRLDLHLALCHLLSTPGLTLTVYQPYISTSYQRPTDTHISTVYQADTAAGKLILVYQPNTRGSHPHRLVYQPHTGT